MQPRPLISPPVVTTLPAALARPARLAAQEQSASEAKKRQSRRHLRLALLLWGPMLSASFASAPSASAKDTPTGAPLAISVYNEAHIPNSTLLDAERIAGRIFHDAGIEVAWLNCEMSGPPGSCLDAVAPIHPQLRILRRSRDLPVSAFGISYLPEHGPGCYGDVFFDPIERSTQDSRSAFISARQALATVLGHVIAHEIGHLLLGSNSHSDSGLMQPNWKPKQIQQAVMGTLLFTRGQAKLIQAEARTRMRLQMASLKERPMGAVDHQVRPKVPSAE